LILISDLKDVFAIDCQEIDGLLFVGMLFAETNEQFCIIKNEEVSFRVKLPDEILKNTTILTAINLRLQYEKL
jgi:hypothetical protein